MASSCEELVWDHDNMEILKEVYAYYGGFENTKQPCENALAECRDQRRANKDKKVSCLRAQCSVCTMEETRTIGKALATLKVDSNSDERVGDRTIAACMMGTSAFESNTH